MWFNTQAVEAAEFYSSLFPDSKILSRNVIKDTPSGDCHTISFEVWGQRFEAISAGPQFDLNPSISMMVNFDPLFFQEYENPKKAATDELNKIWTELGKGGMALMELGEYEFSSLYGWILDRFGMTWQLILTDPGGDPRPPVMPSMLFVGDNCGRAEEAGTFYRSIFPAAEEGLMVKFPEGTVMFSDFKLGESWITVGDSDYDHQFQFNEALSYIISCKDQEEIDYFWEKLSAHGEAEQRGWLKDKFGVSWQIVPEDLSRMLDEGSEKQKEAVTGAFLKMNKIDIAELQRIFKEQGS